MSLDAAVSKHAFVSLCLELWRDNRGPSKRRVVHSFCLHPILEIIKGNEKGNTFFTVEKEPTLPGHVLVHIFWSTKKAWMSDCAASFEYWLQDGPLNTLLNGHWKRLLETPAEYTWNSITSSYEEATETAVPNKLDIVLFVTIPAA